MLNTNQFHYDKNERRFSAEASDLEANLGAELILNNEMWVKSHWSGKMAKFVFNQTFYEQYGEDVMGWEWSNDNLNLTLVIYND